MSGANGAIGTIVDIVAISGIGAIAAVVMKFGTIIAIITIVAIDTIVAIVTNESPLSSIVTLDQLAPLDRQKILDPLTLNGDCELSIAIESIKWRHLNGANSRCTKRQIMRVEILCFETSHIIHHWKDLIEGC